MADMRESNKTILNAVCPKCGVNTNYSHCVCWTGEVNIVGGQVKTNVGELTIDVDVSDALKGLKAITREAKKATEALKELEEQQKKMRGQHVHRVDDSIPHSQQLFDVKAVAKEISKQFSKELSDKVRNKGITY